MKWLICNFGQKTAVEKIVFSRFLKFKLQTNGWNTAYNVRTKQEVDISGMADNAISSSDYPIMGWKDGRVNKTDGFTTDILKFAETTTGMWAAPFPETLNVITDGVDEDGFDIKVSTPTSTAQFIDSLVYTEYTDVTPEFIED